MNCWMQLGRAALEKLRRVYLSSIEQCLKVNVFIQDRNMNTYFTTGAQVQSRYVFL